MDGAEVIQGLRGWTSVPIIVLSARWAERDKVAALDAGADDYVTKPFGMDELLARLRAAIRRHAPAPGSAVIATPDFTVELSHKRIVRNGAEVRLTPTEWGIVEVLVTNADKLVSQRQLLDYVWGPGFENAANNLRVHLAHIRRKLEPEQGEPRYFLTEAGMGYRFRTPEADHMNTPVIDGTERTIDDRELLLGALIGVPAAIGAGALMTISRDFFDTTNAALVMMIVVVAVAAVGGRVAGIITALAAAASFDFFHTRPYLSMTIDSRDDIETTVLLLVAGILAGTLGARERLATRREVAARTEIRRVHRVAEAAASGRPPLRSSLSPSTSSENCCRSPNLASSSPIAPPTALASDWTATAQSRISGTSGTRATRRRPRRLPATDGGVELPVLVHGEEVGHFVLVPTPGIPTTREDRLAAVVIADQVAAAGTSTRVPG